MFETENEFKKVCSIKDLKEKEGKKFLVDDVEIAVFKIDGEIFAVNNVCPHQHSAIIYDGFVENCHVVCPAHGWEFDLRTGKLKSGGKGLDSYETKIEGENVFVRVYKKQLKW